MGPRLRLEVLRAVLARDGDPRLGEDAELLERDVLDGGEDLDLGRVAPGAGDLLADPLEVRAHDARVDAPDQLRHAIPAWRPVTPRSRRWEKKRSSWIVHSPQSWTTPTPAASSRSRASALRSSVRPLVPNAAWTSSPTS